MQAPQPDDGDRIEDEFTTNVYHEGEEVCVRLASQNSRSKHEPDTDDSGDVIFVDAAGNRVGADHDDARPRPKCDVEPNTDSAWVLRPVSSCVNRDPCNRCVKADAIAEKNQANGGSVTMARKLRYGDDWGSSKAGDESSSNVRATGSQGD